VPAGPIQGGSAREHVHPIMRAACRGFYRRDKASSIPTRPHRTTFISRAETACYAFRGRDTGMTVWFFVAKLPQSVVGRPQSQSRLAPDCPRTRGCYPRNESSSVLRWHRLLPQKFCGRTAPACGSRTTVAAPESGSTAQEACQQRGYAPSRVGTRSANSRGSCNASDYRTPYEF